MTVDNLIVTLGAILFVIILILLLYLTWKGFLYCWTTLVTKTVQAIEKGKSNIS